MRRPRRVRHRERDAEDGVGAQPALVGRAVELQQRARRSRAARARPCRSGAGRSRVSTFCDRLRTPLPPQARRRRAARRPPVARRGAGGHRRAAERPGLELNINFNCRVTRGSPGSDVQTRSRSHSLASAKSGLAWRGLMVASCSSSPSTRKSCPSAPASASAASTRARKRAAAPRSASSGSTPARRSHVDGREQQVAGLAPHGLGSAAGPSSAARSSASSSSSLGQASAQRSQSKPMAAARRCTLRAWSRAGRLPARRGRCPRGPRRRA